MTEINFTTTPPKALLLAKEGAQYLGITRRYFRVLEDRGFFKRATPREVNPRYLFQELREFKERAYATGFLPLLPTKGARDLADPSIKDEEFATAAEVAKYLRLSKVTIYDRLQRGLLPKPKKLYEGAHPRWNVGEIRRCISQ